MSHIGATPEPRGQDWLVSATRALLAVAALLAGVWLYARIRNPFPYYGTTYDARPTAPAIAATDQDGRPYTLASERGKAVLLFFGFTHCPNFCPITLSYLEKARARLPEAQRQNVRVLFLTLDPDRDTPANLKSYVRFYSPDLTGLYLPPGQLKGVAQGYGVGYQKTPLTKTPINQGGNYSITHTTATYLIDRAGKLRLVYDYTQLPRVDKVAADLREVLRD